MKIAFAFLGIASFGLLSCVSKPQGIEPKPIEVIVKVTPHDLAVTSRLETTYEMTEPNCHVAWIATVEKSAEPTGVQLQDRTECDRPFAETVELRGKVLDRALKDYPPTAYKSLSTSGLKKLQPDGAWNTVIADAASTSKDYRDYRNKYPKHATKKSINLILVELVQQTGVLKPYEGMLVQHGFNFELNQVEKVFNAKNKKGETVIDDAGVFWWRSVK
jgi:hypothetical protein